MTIVDRTAKRPLPSLSQWLEEKNDGQRSPGWDEFAALSDLAERTILQTDNGLPVNEAAFMRLWQGFLIATVELCNIERERKQTPSEMIVTTLPRAMACAAVYAMASITKPDAPMRSVAKLLTEEFRFAAKQAADDLMEKST